MIPVLGLVAALLAGAGALAAQTGGVISGRVRDAASGELLAGAQVTVLGLQRAAVTDSTGQFRIREVRAGWQRVRVVRVGYRPALRDSVLVRSGETALLEIALQARLDTLPGIDVSVRADAVLDPLTTGAVQRITADDLRLLPVTTLQEAVALQAGAVGESYRGGRVGQQSFVLDGLGVKNQLDASTGGLGLRIPTDLLTEAALVTNGFSARYGQAISGMINVVTRDGGTRWSGRLAYETDRPLDAANDYGLDRLVASLDGPLFGGITLVATADASGRLDADPVNAPRPSDPRDPRAQRPWMLPHNDGEQLDLGAKLRIPVGGGHTLRLFGLRSLDQRNLYDPAFKYDTRWAPARRVDGTLLSAHWSYAARARSEREFLADLRAAWFQRDFMRAPLEAEPERRFGAFTGRRFRFLGEALARAQDTAAAARPLPGFAAPDHSAATPWGVPAFFLGLAPRGDVAFNRFTEWRAQLDLNFGGQAADLIVGGEVVRQRVQTFQRVLAYLPAGDSVPPATAADFSPLTAAAYGEVQARWEDLALTFGLRVDRFDPNTTIGGVQTRARTSVGPRLGVSTVLRGATVVVSWGRFAQAPDFQYLVDAAFDDTTRTGRFRAGNPSLGYETATQYEFSLRARPRPHLAVRLNAYVKRLDGLVASVPLGLDPDSAIFGNTDYGNVRGAEVLLERELHGGWGGRIVYSLQQAEATATNAFQLWRRIRIAPGGADTILPARVEFPLDYDRRHGLTVLGQARVPERTGPRLAGVRPLATWEAAVIWRVQTGLPYTRTNAAGDTLLGLPNSYRLPSQSTLDVLVRRPLALGRVRGAVYVDARNVMNRRNIVAVRRDTGAPGLNAADIARVAQAAYAAHPEPIPYESPRYRREADLDGNGLIQGQAELLPLFEAAARDYYQPLFAFGPPRLFRVGVELAFSGAPGSPRRAAVR